MPISINDNLKVIQKHMLSGEDYFVLAQMYLPIIGIDGFGLYNLLFTLDVNEPHSFKKILDSLNFNSLNFLTQAFHKLEAVALIESYFHEQKGFLYLLKTPLSRTSFLQNTLLSSFLTTQIGEVEVMKMRTGADQANLRSYKDISKSFDEVYDVTHENVENVFNRIFKIKNNKGIRVLNPDFDYIFFKMSFDSAFIDPKILDDEEFKQQILAISFNYKLNEEEMKTAIEKTITVNRDLKYEDISKHARDLFQEKNKNKTMRVVTKDDDAFLNSQTDDSTFQLVQMLDSMAPADLLKHLSKIAPAVSEIKIFEDLINNTKFPVGVINVMILYVNNQKQGEMPGYNYFEKIANSWARAHITNTKAALDYINRPQTERSGKTYNPAKKVAKLPDWYEKYEKDLEKTVKPEPLSEEEKKKVLEEANKRFND